MSIFDKIVAWFSSNNSKAAPVRVPVAKNKVKAKKIRKSIKSKNK